MCLDNISLSGYTRAIVSENGSREVVSTNLAVVGGGSDGKGFKESSKGVVTGWQESGGVSVSVFAWESISALYRARKGQPIMASYFPQLITGRVKGKDALPIVKEGYKMTVYMRVGAIHGSYHVV